jgi:hypothetical protein
VVLKEFSFWPLYVSEIDSASNINKYQEYFLESKGGRCLGLTTLPHLRADFLEIKNPQPLGNLRACPDMYKDSVQVCTGIALLSLNGENTVWTPEAVWTRWPTSRNP